MSDLPPQPQIVQAGSPTAPASQTIYIQQSGAPASNGMAVASLVLGIISLLPSWLPVFSFFTALPCSVIGLILGLIAVRRPVGKGMAVGGIICSAITVVIHLGWIIFFVLIAGAVGAAATGAAIAPH